MPAGCPARATLIGNEIPTESSSHYDLKPALNYNPDKNEYLIVWTRQDLTETATADVWGRRLAADGTPLGASFPIAANSSFHEQNPTVVYGNGHYLVFWEERPFAGENVEIAGQLVDDAGMLSGNKISITNWAYDQLKPRAAYNSKEKQFLVVWEDHYWGNGNDWDIYGRFLDGNGSFLGAEIALSWEGSQHRLNPEVAYQAAINEYVLTWEVEETTGGHSIFFRRIKKDGTLPEGELVLGAFFQYHPVVAVDNNLGAVFVWETDYHSAQGLQIYGRLATLPTTEMDLSIDHIELTQGIQCQGNSHCPDNSVPLVDGKNTLARIYVKVTGTAQEVPGVTAKARVLNQSFETMPFYNQTITARLQPDRSKFSDTLNFILPANQVNASDTLEVEVNFNKSVVEKTSANNKKTVSLNFVNTKPLMLFPVFIMYLDQQPFFPNFIPRLCDFQMPASLTPYTKNLLPVPGVVWSNWWYVLPWIQPLLDGDGSWGNLLNAIRDLHKKCTSCNPDAHFYGLIPFQVPQGSTAGLGDFPGKDAIGRAAVTHADLEDGADILVHELGHNFNRQHAPCGVNGADSAYPYPNALLGDFGYDPQGAAGGRVQSLPGGWIVPSNSFDIMSYCQDEWISEYTYRSILNYRGSSPVSLAETEPTPTLKPRANVSLKNDPTRLYLFISGSLNNGQWGFDPGSILERPLGFSDGAGVGSYSLRLTGAQGEVLFERRFEPQASQPGWLEGTPANLKNTPPSYSFYEIIPWDSAATRIQLLQGATLLAEKPVSSSAPTVQITEPLAGSNWDQGLTTVSWQSQDPDGDPLWFDVYFSPDNGATWEILANRLQTNRLDVYGRLLPGTDQALIRVFASDGIRTAYSTSGLIRTTPKPPEPFIVSPASGKVFPPGYPVRLEGMAIDREDGPLSGATFSWHSNRDGSLGTGNDFWVALSAGVHQITLTAKDSGNQEAGATATICVGECPVHLPLIIRN